MAVNEFAIGPSDRLLFHTADGATYLAVADFIKSRSAHDLPLLHICTPYDPVGVMPNRDKPEDIREAVETFKDAGLLNRRIFLYGENPYLATHLSETWQCLVRPLELPAHAIDEDMKFQARRYRSEKLGLSEASFVISSLGAARLEKGFHLLPDVVRRTFELAGSKEFPDVPSSRVKFVLHASAQIVGRHPVILKAIEKLSVFPQAQVELIEEPLSDTEYRNLTLASDCILMPYDDAAYRVRGSGVVSEAIVARKFIVAKSGSYPAAMAEWQGGASGETPLSMARAILTIIQNRWEKFERVKNAAIEYVSENSVDQYVRKLVSAERQQDHV